MQATHAEPSVVATNHSQTWIQIPPEWIGVSVEDGTDFKHDSCIQLILDEAEDDHDITSIYEWKLRLSNQNDQSEKLRSIEQPKKYITKQDIQEGWGVSIADIIQERSSAAHQNLNPNIAVQRLIREKVLEILLRSYKISVHVFPPTFG